MKADIVAADDSTTTHSSRASTKRIVQVLVEELHNRSGLIIAINAIKSELICMSVISVYTKRSSHDWLMFE